MLGLLLRLSTLLGLLNGCLGDRFYGAAELRLVNVRSAFASGVEELLALAPSVLGLGLRLGHGGLRTRTSLGDLRTAREVRHG